MTMPTTLSTMIKLKKIFCLMVTKMVYFELYKQQRLQRSGWTILKSICIVRDCTSSANIVKAFSAAAMPFTELFYDGTKVFTAPAKLP